MDWTRGHTIGRGSTATVSVATSIQSGDVFAVKSVELSQSGFLQREQKILSSIISPFIVSYKGCEVTRKNNKVMYNLFLEYMPSGSLSNAIHAHDGGRLDESLIRIFTYQILQGLDYLHLNGLVHCDIKSSNILVAQSGAKIADFGCAKRVEQQGPIAGTPMFMAPEVARGEEQGFASDIWALGCTVIEMASGGTPWHNQIQESTPSSTSPTSILDQGIWNSLDESESLESLVLVPSGGESSAGERIRGLSLLSGEPSWDCDDQNWITAREGGSEEGDTVMDDIEYKDQVDGW
ncbi:hypothetical protein D5086_026826 [Populus alba]|uniref:Uncharacterized protein n=1 Tax=Populus alba TaxID=43335 RepID=A0ACC4B326_POPAL